MRFSDECAVHEKLEPRELKDDNASVEATHQRLALQVAFGLLAYSFMGTPFGELLAKKAQVALAIW